LGEFDDVSYTMTWNNDTKNVVVTYSSPEAKNFCLTVNKIDAYDSRRFYNNCNLTAASGTLIAKINESGTFQASFYAYASPTQVISALEIINGAWQQVAQVIGIDGLIYTVLLAGTLGGLGLAMGSAVLAIGGTVLGVAAMSIFGFIKVSYSMVIAILILGIIAITRLRERI